MEPADSRRRTSHRQNSVGFGPGPLQSLTVDSRLSAVADSERPGQTLSLTVLTGSARSLTGENDRTPTSQVRQRLEATTPA